MVGTDISEKVGDKQMKLLLHYHLFISMAISI